MRAAHGAGRRLVVLLGGGALLVAGLALLVLPGPGLPLIFAGLALLGTEFEVARRAQRRLLSRMRQAASRARGRRRA